jgi:hypothetical protein
VITAVLAWAGATPVPAWIRAITRLMKNRTLDLIELALAEKFSA